MYHVWSGPDFVMLGRIAELLSVEHRYVELPSFQRDEFHVLIAFYVPISRFYLCVSFTVFLKFCALVYAVQYPYIK